MGFHKRNYPQHADFYMMFLAYELCMKNTMFNLNENNRIVMAQQPTDIRMGVNCLCSHVRMVNLDPTNGDVYIFVDRSRKMLKILHWEYGGISVGYLLVVSL